MERISVNIKEISLLSLKWKIAKKVSFDPKQNVIMGTNDVGKSSLIKTIYHTLGADVSFASKWNDAAVTSLLTIDIGDREYKVLRTQSFMGLFDSNYNLIGAYKSITKEFSEKFAQLFNNKLKLKHAQTGTRMTLTPAAQLLPFYVDQDKSWTEPWNGFEGLGMFTGYKRDLLDFYCGLKPNEYYKLSEKIEIEKDKLRNIKSEKSVIRKAQESVEKSMPRKTFNVDIKDFKKEVDELVKECQRLTKIEEKYRKELLKLKNNEAFIDLQLNAAQTAIKEVEKDYQYSLGHEEIQCPMCYTDFDNSLASRFSFLSDVDDCRELVSQFLEEKKEISKKLYSVESSLNKHKKIRVRIESILNEKRGRVKLQEVIESVSSKQINKAFDQSFRSYESDINLLEESIDVNTKKRAGLLNIERKKDIQETYNTFMDTYLFTLNVHTIREKAYKNLPTKIDDKGSDKPRALIAYYMSIIKTMMKHTSSPIFPLIIDSPNQQDQDYSNINNMIKFIFDEVPTQQQLILGTVELHNVPFEGKVIELSEKYSLMSEKYFDECSKEIKPLIDAVHQYLVSTENSSL